MAQARPGGPGRGARLEVASIRLTDVEGPGAGGASAQALPRLRSGTRRQRQQLTSLRNGRRTSRANRSRVQRLRGPPRGGTLPVVSRKHTNRANHMPGTPGRVPAPDQGDSPVHRKRGSRYQLTVRHDGHARVMIAQQCQRHGPRPAGMHSARARRLTGDAYRAIGKRQGSRGRRFPLEEDERRPLRHEHGLRRAVVGMADEPQRRSREP